MGQFGSVESSSSYETNASTFLANITWKAAKNTEVYWDFTWVTTDAEWKEINPVFASDVPTLLFPGGVPGPGADPLPDPGDYAGPNTRDSDYLSLATVGEFSKLEYEEMRTTLGARWQITNGFGIFGQISYWDLEDKTAYLFQDLTGTVTLGQAGITWYF